MRWDWQVVTWAAVALLLFAAETLAPGAFMLWLGFAAAAVFVVVLLFRICRCWRRSRCSSCSASSRSRSTGAGSAAGARQRPAHAQSPRRALIGRVVPLERAIVNGQRTRADRRCVLGRALARTWPRARRCASSAVDGMSLRVEPLA